MALKKRPAKTKDTEQEALVDFSGKTNEEKFTDELRVIFSAAVGVVAVRTKEIHRAAYTLFGFAVMLEDTRFNVWTVTNGWKEIPTSHAPATRPSSVVSPVGGGFSFPEIRVSPDPMAEATAPGGDLMFELYERDNLGNGVTFPDRALKELFNRILPPRLGQPPSEDALSGSINVMFAADWSFEDPSVQEHIRAFSNKALENDARLVLLVHDTAVIPEKIADDIRILDFLPPSAPELMEVCEQIIDGMVAEDEAISVELTEKQKQTIVKIGMGMTSYDFGTALSMALVRQEVNVKDGNGLDFDKLFMDVSAAKTEAVRKSPFLDILTPVPEENVGGLYQLKEYIRERKKAFSPEARKFGVVAPKGILVAGPPGTGKSLIGKTIASMLGLACVAFDIGKVFGGLVGQSEGQMRAALKQIESVAPCVLLMDEVDKGLAGTGGGGGNDGGTTSRVFGTLLTWMQERKPHDAPVYVVMTANNTEHLPAELLRKGRVDEIWHVGFPDAEDRKVITKIHLRIAGHEVPDEELEGMIQQTERFVGAELENIVSESVLRAFNEGLERPTGEFLEHFAVHTRPLSEVMSAKVKVMEEWAALNARSATWKKPEHVQASVSAKAPSAPGARIRPLRPRIR